MTTIIKIDETAAMALALHAKLSEFAIDTLEPTQKAAYQELANSAAYIRQRLELRREQIADRQAQIQPNLTNQP